MPALQIMITDAGIEAIADAQGGATEAVVITEIGLTDTPFIMAPTLELLPGEFRRIATVAGQAVAENILHVTAYDAAAIAYDVTGFGIYAGATLIAVYSEAEDPILSKAALATSMFAIDISIAADQAAVIEFGDPIFMNPPATEAVAGVAKISTNALADAGVDDTTIMSPKKVKRVLDAALAAINAAVDAFMLAANGAIAAIAGRTITGGGLATGGGDLTANRVITVPKASAAEVTTGTDDAKAITPLAFATAMGTRSLGSIGYVSLFGFIIQWGTYSASANSSVSPSFPTTFPASCLFATCAGGRQDYAAQDNNPFVSASTTSGLTVYNSADAGVNGNWFAIGC